MKLFQRKRKPNYQHIAQLERSLGLDDDAILGRRTKKRVLSKPVILAPKPAGMHSLQQLAMAPGFKWLVNDPCDIIPMNICATASYGPSTYAPPKPSVVIPKGVHFVG